MSERDHWDIQNDFNKDEVWDTGENPVTHVSSGDVQPPEYPKLTRKERITLAEDIYNGDVFTDRHCFPKDFAMVFVVFMFMDEEQKASYQLDLPGMVYEYIDKSAPRSVNGMPIFFSCRMLSQEEAVKVWGLYKMIVDRKGEPSERKKV